MGHYHQDGSGGAEVRVYPAQEQEDAFASFLKYIPFQILYNTLEERHKERPVFLRRNLAYRQQDLTPIPRQESFTVTFQLRLAEDSGGILDGWGERLAPAVVVFTSQAPRSLSEKSAVFPAAPDEAYLVRVPVVAPGGGPVPIIAPATATASRAPPAAAATPTTPASAAAPPTAPARATAAAATAGAATAGSQPTASARAPPAAPPTAAARATAAAATSASRPAASLGTARAAAGPATGAAVDAAVAPGAAAAAGGGPAGRVGATAARAHASIAVPVQRTQMPDGAALANRAAILLLWEDPSGIPPWLHSAPEGRLHTNARGPCCLGAGDTPVLFAHMALNRVSRSWPSPRHTQQQQQQQEQEQEQEQELVNVALKRGFLQEIVDETGNSKLVLSCRAPPHAAGAAAAPVMAAAAAAPPIAAAGQGVRLQVAVSATPLFGSTPPHHTLPRRIDARIRRVGGARSGGAVVFRYSHHGAAGRYHDEETEDYECHMCSMRCRSYSGLRLHLVASHFRYTFDFSRFDPQRREANDNAAAAGEGEEGQEDDAILIVHVSCKRSSLLLVKGTQPEISHFYFQRPKRRRILPPEEEALDVAEPAPSGSTDAADVDPLERPSGRQAARRKSFDTAAADALNRERMLSKQFYHSRTGQPITREELLEGGDSEDEVDHDLDDINDLHVLALSCCCSSSSLLPPPSSSSFPCSLLPSSSSLLPSSSLLSLLLLPPSSSLLLVLVLPAFDASSSPGSSLLLLPLAPPPLQSSPRPAHRVPSFSSLRLLLLSAPSLQRTGPDS